MSFSALRDRVNSQTLASLGDAVTKGGLPLPGRFDNAYFDAGNMVTQTNPIFEHLDGALVVNDQIVVNAITYRVVDLQPDGEGMTLAQLEKI